MEEVVPTVMDTIIGAVSGVISMVGTVFTAMTENPVLLFCLAAGLLPVAIGIFRSLKGAAA